MTYAQELSRGGLSALAVSMRHGVSVAQVIADRKAIQKQRDQQRRAEKMAPILQAQAEAERARIEAEIAAREAVKAEQRRISQMDPEGRDRASMARWLALDIRFEDDPRSRAWSVAAAAVNDAIFSRRRSHFRTLGGVADYSSQPEAA